VTSLRSAYFTSGFRGAHRDAALREVVQPPISSAQQHELRDPDPCPPEDEECFDAPDAASMEEAISKFVESWSHRSAVDLMTFTDS
jgi:hypothetical protein